MAKKLISIATLFVLMAVSVFSAFAVEDETKNALVYGDVNIDGDITVIDATDIRSTLSVLKNLQQIVSQLQMLIVTALFLLWMRLQFKSIL